MAQNYFSVDGVRIATPTAYKPVFATTSTSDSDRTQDLIMHNTPMGTIQGYDLEWGVLKPEEISTILQAMINKPSFMFHYASPYTGQWETGAFYASNFSMDTQILVDGMEKWKGLSINVRSINPI